LGEARRAFPFGARARRLAAAIALAVLAADEAATLPPGLVTRTLRLAALRVRGEVIPPAQRLGFFFDPEYESFLAEVARRTPAGATVAIIVPERPDIYRYQAVYTLAPRRVVDEPRASEADWLAVWGPRRADVAGGLPIGRAGALAPLPRAR
jgi:hypothetical protein